jgi:hypothetical protein
LHSTAASGAFLQMRDDVVVIGSNNARNFVIGCGVGE